MLFVTLSSSSFSLGTFCVGPHNISLQKLDSGIAFGGLTPTLNGSVFLLGGLFNVFRPDRGNLSSLHLSFVEAALFDGDLTVVSQHLVAKGHLEVLFLSEVSNTNYSAPVDLLSHQRLLLLDVFFNGQHGSDNACCINKFS